MQWLLIAAGGAIGAVLRYAVSNSSRSFFGTEFPYGTLIVNVIGSFILGLLVILLVEKYTTSENLRLFLFVGVLGAFTTFSTFSVESVDLFATGRQMAALLNMALNLFASVFAAAFGLYLGKMLA